MGSKDWLIRQTGECKTPSPKRQAIKGGLGADSYFRGAICLTCRTSRWRTENGTLSKSHPCAPVAQLDRAVASEATGREFESLRAHHQFCRFAPNRFRSISVTTFFSLVAEGSAIRPHPS